jgi:hypothetical protein
MPKLVTMRRAALLLMATGLSGCGTYQGEKVFVVDASDLKPGNTLGASFTAKGQHSYDKVWKAAMTAMSTDMTVMESHRPSGVIKSRIGAAPSGKVVGFWITPTLPNAPSYRIETLSVRPIGINSVGGTAWEPKVVEDFEAALNAR